MSSRIRVLGDPGSGLARVRARGSSSTQATQLAAATAGQAVQFLRGVARANLISDTRRSSFGFDGGRESWPSRSVFSNARVAPQRGLPRRHTQEPEPLSSLAPRPQRSVAVRGVRLIGPFEPGVQYAARGYVRAASGRTAVRFVLGADSGDVSVGKPQTLGGGGYVPLDVRWTPSKGDPSSILALQTSGSIATVLLDAVSVEQPRLAPADQQTSRAAQSDLIAARAQRAATADRFIDVGEATPVADLPSSTGSSSLLGALLGALAALTGWLLGSRCPASPRSRGRVRPRLEGRGDPPKDCRASGRLVPRRKCPATNSSFA